MRIFFAVLLSLAGCSPANLEELRCEGEVEMRKLTAELKKIETNEDAQKARVKLNKHFNRIANLLIAARNFPLAASESQEIAEAGEELFAELARIYEIPGARAAVEAAQTEAVRRLDKSKTSQTR